MFDNINKKPDPAQAPQSQIPVPLTQNPQTSTQPATLNQGVTQPIVQQKATVGSSPWEDDLDLPEDTKDKPRIIGSLDPSGQASGVFSVPANVEEKVGNKIPAIEAIKKSNVAPAPAPATVSTPTSQPIVAQPAPAASVSTAAAPSVPIASATSQAAPKEEGAEIIDDFDWFGDSASAPASVPPKAVAAPAPAKNIDIPKPTTQPVANISPTISQTASSSSLSYVPIDPFASSETQANSSAISQETQAPNADIAKNASLSTNAQAAPVEQITEKKLSKYLHFFNFKIFSIAIGAILAIFILFIVLTEYGILNIGVERVYGSVGMERIWGGLSKNPEKALLRSFSVMKSNSDFKAEGKIDMTVDSGVKSSVTSPLISTKTVDGNFIKSVSSNILFFTNSQSSLAKISLTSDLGQNEISVQNSGNKLYVLGNDKIKFSNNTDPLKWVAYSLSALSDKTVQKDLFNVNSNSGMSIRGSRIKSEKIAGENCFHYQIDALEPGNAFSSFGIDSDMIQSASGEVWIGIKSKLIKRVVLKIVTSTSSPVALMALDLNFYDYGVSNEIPAISESVIADTTTKILTGDEKRKDDLDQISASLAKYKEANGVYPTSSNILVPLNSTGNMLISTLVPSFMPKLPFDEKAAAGWYYAYKSDGISYSLSARLESTTDPDGTLVGSVYLYIKNSL